jgi:hypothetical protein
MIPFITHRVWLTNPKRPREILGYTHDAIIQYAVDTLDALNKVHSNWDHIIWTNDKTLIPESVRYLSDKGFSFRELTEL